MPETPESPSEEQHPIRGGSFIRQADGTLVPEHPLVEPDPVIAPPEAAPPTPPRPPSRRPTPVKEP